MTASILDPITFRVTAMHMAISLDTNKTHDKTSHVIAAARQIEKYLKRG